MNTGKALNRAKTITIASLMLCVGWLVMSWLVPVNNKTPNVVTSPKADINKSQPVVLSALNIMEFDFPSPPSPLAPQKKPRDVAKKETNEVDLTGSNNRKLESMGMSLLDETSKRNTPDIEFSWPKESSEQRRIANILRQCVGVRLAKVNADGTFSASEQYTKNISPYARAIIGYTSQEESAVINQWRGLPGQVVRLYPLKADAVLLGSLMSLLNKDQNLQKDAKQIKGQYVINGKVLKINSITINGNTQEGELVVSKGC